MVLVVVNEHLFIAHYLKAISVDKNRTGLIDTNAEQVRMSRDYLVQVCLAMTHDDVLVDRGVLQQRKSNLMSGNHHDVIVAVGILRIPSIAAHQKRALNRGTG